jgi:hypothetical protein
MKQFLDESYGNEADLVKKCRPYIAQIDYVTFMLLFCEGGEWQLIGGC